MLLHYKFRDKFFVLYEFCHTFSIKINEKGAIMKIPFNKPHSTGKELQYITEAIASGQTSGNGPFTQKCNKLLESEYGFRRPLLTSSCTDALEMSALLIGVKPGDEVIVPSYTFVSTALAFARQGVRIVFADSRTDNPCIDEEKIEYLITEKTKAIVPVHYSGISCDMDKILEIASRYNLRVIEDAAHAFGATYKGRLLGTIGDLGCFSFHETKLLHCGEGGMLSVNNESFIKRAEIIWEKGTNRFDFQRGNVRKYEWIDTGSSFLMSDISAAFLYSQLREAGNIIAKRKTQWELYFKSLHKLEIDRFIILPVIPPESEINFSQFYIICRNSNEREQLINKLNASGIQSLTHYLDLSESPYILKNQPVKLNGHENPNSIKYQNTLLRLPLYHDLEAEEIIEISNKIKEFYRYNGTAAENIQPRLSATPPLTGGEIYDHLSY
jgi:dTDP-4-amino-4,6-dideoxygalactose transaminase